MAWIASFTNDSTDQKAAQTQNGPVLLNSGVFALAYSNAGYIPISNSTSEFSILYGVNDTSNANFTANTVVTSPLPTQMTYLNLSNDPTGKSPVAAFALPGSSQLNVPTAPLGALVEGTWLSGRIIGKWLATGTPAFQVRMHLRSPVTGKVVYTIADSTAFTTVAANDLGLKINPSFIVTKGGASGQIIGTLDINYGVNGYQSKPTVTTVDCTQSYILDVSVKFGAASASNAPVFYGVCFELIG
jgi:hypothetical protein